MTKSKRKRSTKPRRPLRMTWRELRESLGKSKDRAGALKLLSACTGYVPLPHQLRGHLASANDGTTHKLMLGGLGSGKTAFSVAELIIMILLNPGCSHAVIAPTYSQVLENLYPRFDELAESMHKAGYPIIARHKKSIAITELVCGGRIFWRSASRVDTIRGFEFTTVTFDESEALFNPMYPFDVLAGRIREPANLRQMLVTTTPRGERGVPLKFKRMREAADGMEAGERTEMRRQWWVGRAKSTENHHLPDGYLDSLRAGYSRRAWLEEVEAVVLKPSHTVFGDEWDRDRHVIPWVYGGEPYALGVDWGTRPAVLFFANIGQSWVLFDEFVEDVLSYDRQKQAIVSLCRKLGKDPIACAVDRANRNLNSWLMGQYPKADVLKMNSRDEQRIKDGINCMRQLFDPADQAEPKLYVSSKLLRTEAERGFIRSIENYRYATRKDGSADFDRIQKNGQWDHQIDACRYASVAILGKDSRPYVIGARVNRSRDRFGDARARKWR